MKDIQWGGNAYMLILKEKSKPPNYACSVTAISFKERETKKETDETSRRKYKNVFKC